MTLSETTNSSKSENDCLYLSASGNEAAGFVPQTHKALISPLEIASNIWMAFKPSLSTMLGASQNLRTRSILSRSNPICAANIFASPPTSRPPIAFGCPVNENGEAPGLPIRPVAR